ncbi:apolipoprotein N-acyltransferase [Nocardioides sp. GY 10113]|uniref:apolipoprotein N-acyltransferase n=1 Tax=Nocardioides sp. GY 10113 TaxID=2569761 RepID=UPI0010A8EF1C|nr:apolipoprotein N-acyltransferase [Nocardioides sp. GY 10113]TIC87663.1 apolipoprotein N-acyltransferase [Nocardioides sp. GY 10113]
MTDRRAWALRCAVATLAGLITSAAFEPIAWPVLLPLGVALFGWSCTGLTVRRAALTGWLFGIAFYFTHIDWMRSSIGPDAWLGLSTLESLFYAAAGAAMPLVRRLPAWPLWAAAVWTAAECLRSVWPASGMPWGRLAFATIDTPAAPAVAYLGMTGLSFALALLGFLLVHAADRHAGGTLWLRLAPAVGLVALLVVPAVAPYDVTTDRTVAVAAVQGNVPGPGNDILYDSRGVTANHVQATEDLAADVAAGRVERPDFVVWPENSTAVDPFDDREVSAGIRRAVSAIDVPVVVGGLVDDPEPGHILNQGIVWDPVTGPGDRYTKRHPVPYGEYIPFRDLWDPKFGQLALITRDMRAGTRTTPLRVDGALVGDAICFDIAYDDVTTTQVRNGAQMLMVQTSNASFIFTHQIEQQFAITRLRALEAGRWLVVASTNGRSGVIAPSGEVVASADPRTTAVLSERVGLSDTLTPAVRMGDWPARLLSLAALLGLALGALAYRRNRHDAGVPTEPAPTPSAVVPSANEAPVA